ncbi:hypothetical protein Sgleb_14120 [Streptomyces glebosus]|uniref:Uncharacterized protein n=1 Tax=Streptomyces glebosus TaxID=249580 RepID=A0A640SUZ6_9ACTN|nr:hypothetical protein Sgleb_14120 [Streptomyces glebosus]GHG66251.1 hypothetical protein GCM10010513_35200 [Streptomyces glebosus]
MRASVGAARPGRPQLPRARGHLSGTVISWLRTGAGPAAERFYDEHVEADAVHEQVVRTEVVEGLLKDEPDLEPDVAFGIGATTQPL